ncbi:CsbD family protein [Dinoroseobacter sp. S76]|uniref:CsbD family protein n=1 Tax=Dinoroseobacter sp. S76 TaxID=3415124 RepID=UPI003C7C83EB
MNWDQIEGEWKQFKGKVQDEWGKLTGDEIDRIDGNRERLEGTIQSKYGKTKEDAKKEVDRWLEDA